MKDTEYYFLGRRNKKIEEKAKDLKIEILFVKEINSLDDLKKLKRESDEYDITLIKIQNIEQLRKAIDKAHALSLRVFVLGISDTINRIALEHKKTSALVSPEFGRVRDFINYRNSGLNHVLCKIAKENGKEIIENFSDLIDSDKKTKAVILGRILQNARLCKKYDVRFSIKNMARSEKEIFDYLELNNLQKVLLFSSRI